MAATTARAAAPNPIVFLDEAPCSGGVGVPAGGVLFEELGIKTLLSVSRVVFDVTEVYLPFDYVDNTVAHNNTAFGTPHDLRVVGIPIISLL